MVPRSGKNGSLYAVSAGIVISKRNGNSGYGHNIVIAHPSGHRSQYAHMSSIKVKKGQPVRVGQYLGEYGNTGNSFGAHLHFNMDTGKGEIGSFRRNIDPWAFLRHKAGKP